MRSSSWVPCTQACFYSDVPYKCQVDLSIEVEQKAGTITGNGYTIDSRLG